jgi:hypothetical protein
MCNTWDEVYESEEEESIFLEWFQAEITALVRKETKFKLPQAERQLGYTDPNKKTFLAHLKRQNRKRQSEPQLTIPVGGHRDSDAESEGSAIG